MALTSDLWEVGTQVRSCGDPVQWSMGHNL